MFIYLNGIQVRNQSYTIRPLAVLAEAITAYREVVDTEEPEHKCIIDTDTGMYFVSNSFEEIKQMLDPDSDWTRDAPVPVEPLPLNMGQ